MVTGDNEKTAAAVADQLGIDDVRAGVAPQDKHRAIREFRDAGRKVAMAGDGINDAPALAEADIGIAMGSGTDVAIESAGITLVRGDLRGIVRALTLSRRVMRNIRGRIFSLPSSTTASASPLPRVFCTPSSASSSAPSSRPRP